MFISTVTRLVLVTALALSLAGIPQLAIAKGSAIHDIPVVKHFDRSSP